MWHNCFSRVTGYKQRFIHAYVTRSPPIGIAKLSEVFMNTALCTLHASAQKTKIKVCYEIKVCVLIGPRWCLSAASPGPIKIQIVKERPPHVHPWHCIQWVLKQIMNFQNLLFYALSEVFDNYRSSCPVHKKIPVLHLEWESNMCLSLIEGMCVGMRKHRHFPQSPDKKKPSKYSNSSINCVCFGLHAACMYPSLDLSHFRPLSWCGHLDFLP